MQTDVQIGHQTIATFRNRSTDLLSYFFIIVYDLIAHKIVYDRFWVIYGIAENPRPTGKCVK